MNRIEEHFLLPIPFGSPTHYVTAVNKALNRNVLFEQSPHIRRIGSSLDVEK
jgi:hypothetical protein